MNISFTNIDLSPLVSPLPAATERSQKATAASSADMQGDQVSVRKARLLEEDEVEGVLSSTMSAITEDPYSAMHAHGGLDASRVAALLA